MALVPPEGAPPDTAGCEVAFPSRDLFVGGTRQRLTPRFVRFVELVLAAPDPRRMQDFSADTFLDVFMAEPLPPDSPFRDLPNAIVSPHSAAASDGLADRVAAIFCENLGRWRRGEPLLNRVSGNVAVAPRP